MTDHDKKINLLLDWIKKTTPENADILIPISGGTDSALCFWLYNQVYPDRTLGVYFGESLRCHDWFASQGKVRIMKLSEDVFEDMELFRWAKCIEIGLLENRILIGNRNKTEHIMGSFSLASRVSSFLPLMDLWKYEILELCQHIGVAPEVIESSSQADPRCGRPEELAQIPFLEVDRFLMEKIGINDEVASISSEQKEYLEDLYRQGSFKRYLPIKPA